MSALRVSKSASGNFRPAVEATRSHRDQDTPWAITASLFTTGTNKAAGMDIVRSARTLSRWPLASHAACAGLRTHRLNLLVNADVVRLDCLRAVLEAAQRSRAMCQPRFSKSGLARAHPRHGREAGRLTKGLPVKD